MGLRDYLQAKKHEYRFVDPDIKNRDGKMPEWFTGYVKYLDAAKEKKYTTITMVPDVKSLAAGKIKAVEREKEISGEDIPAWLLVGELSADGKTASGIWVAPLPATAAAAIESIKQRGG